MKRSAAAKIKSLTELAPLLDAAREQDQRIVLTNGCFDLLHAGHLASLERAARLGDILVVAVNSDDSVRRLKRDGRPLVGHSDRARLLAGLECVDFVVIFEQDTPVVVIQALRPHVHYKAGYTREQLPEAQLVEALGGEVIAESYEQLGTQGLSTSALLARVRENG